MFELSRLLLSSCTENLGRFNKKSQLTWFYNAESNTSFKASLNRILDCQRLKYFVAREKVALEATWKKAPGKKLPKNLFKKKIIWFLENFYRWCFKTVSRYWTHRRWSWVFLYQYELVKPALPQSAQLGIKDALWLITKDKSERKGKVERKGKRKKKSQAGIQPLTSWSPGECSTAVLQLQPMC